MLKLLEGFRAIVPKVMFAISGVFTNTHQRRDKKKQDVIFFSNLKCVQW